MFHQTFRIDDVVPQHLNRFRIHHVDMFLVTHGLCKFLYDHFPHRPPLGTGIHDEDMISACDQIADVRRRSEARDGALFVQKLTHHATVGDDDGRARSQFEGEDSSVHFCPLGKSIARVNFVTL